jgi:hypothetical protein
VLDRADGTDVVRALPVSPSPAIEPRHVQAFDTAFAQLRKALDVSPHIAATRWAQRLTADLDDLRILLEGALA